MKQYLFCLIILSFTFLQSCQIEHVDKDKIEMAKKRQAEKQKQRKEEQKKKKQQKKADITSEDEIVAAGERLPIPSFESLTASRKQTLAAINQVNGEYVMMQEAAIKITGDVIKIKGTAIDRPMTKSPAGAYIKIGNKTFPVENWLPRKKYAEKAKNPDYLMSAFEVEIPTSEINSGTKIMTLLVVSSDRENYYTAPEKVKIII